MRLGCRKRNGRVRRVDETSSEQGQQMRSNLVLIQTKQQDRRMEKISGGLLDQDGRGPSTSVDGHTYRILERSRTTRELGLLCLCVCEVVRRCLSLAFVLPVEPCTRQLDVAAAPESGHVDGACQADEISASGLVHRLPLTPLLDSCLRSDLEVTIVRTSRE
jgi:hypothetical protein